MKKLKTNEDLVRDLMKFSKYGALSQMMIIQAISYYTSKVQDELTEEFIKEQEDKGKRNIVCNRSWKGVAIEIEGRMLEFYNK